MGETVPPSTLQGKYFHSSILSAYAFQLNFDDSDSGYMTTSGPCPISKLSSHSALFILSDVNMRPVGTNNKQRSAPNTGPLTSLRFPSGVVAPSLIARLGFRVRFFCFLPLPQN